MPTPPLPRLALLTAAIVVLAACGTPAEDDRDAAIAERDAQIEQLTAQVAELEEEIARLRDRETPPPDADPDRDPAERPAAPRTAEGLVEQLHTYFAGDAGLDLGFEPAPTPWEPAEVPDGFGEGAAAFDTAGDLMTALAAEHAGPQLGAGAVWEVATRVLFDHPEGDPDADQATGAVLVWGFLDDAIFGSDHRYALRRAADGWYAESAEERSRCARGVAEGLCV